MFRFNKVIQLFILSDLLIASAWGFIGPVFAVFLLESIHGGSASVAGIAAGIYWIAKSIVQIPIGKYLDRNHGEKDDYWFMVIGLFVSSFVPLGFLVSSQPWHIYVLNFAHAICMAAVVPPWGGIFTRHMDKGKEAESWSFESSAIGLGAGIAGVVGGLVAASIGFAPLFIGVSVLSFVGTLLLLFVKKNIVPHDGKTVPLNPFKKLGI